MPVHQRVLFPKLLSGFGVDFFLFLVFTLNFLVDFSMAVIDLVNMNASFQEVRTEVGLFLLLLLRRKCVCFVKYALLRANIIIISNC
jgi:hypothetical protein